MSAPALPPEEADILQAVLMNAFMENEYWLPLLHPWLSRARDLAARGFLALTDQTDMAVARVTNLGARALISSGVIKARDLAGGAGVMLRQLRFYRSAYERGVTDRSLGDLSWGLFGDTPHNRAAAGALQQRGHVERRDSARGLSLRATDEGMKAP
nr:hypothetical protein [uncultured Brevundimonas sp.]